MPVEEIKGFKRLLQLNKARNWLIGLVTMGDMENVEFILKALKVRGFFDVIVSGEQIRYGKPHPEVHQLSIDHSGVTGRNFGV